MIIIASKGGCSGSWIECETGRHKDSTSEHRSWNKGRGGGAGGDDSSHSRPCMVLDKGFSHGGRSGRQAEKERHRDNGRMQILEWAVSSSYLAMVVDKAFFSWRL